jgi:hypothetical protein
MFFCDRTCRKFDEKHNCEGTVKNKSINVKRLSQIILIEDTDSIHRDNAHSGSWKQRVG